MRVLIADDSLFIREGAARILTDAGMDVVAQAADAEDLMRKVRAHKPDVAIVDVRMPPGDGPEGLKAAKVIRRELPDTGVLMLSQYVEDHYVTELLEAGTEGVGYLLKDRVADVERFTDAIRRVAQGGSVLDPEVVAMLMGGRNGGKSADDGLTAREREVLALMAEGRTNKGIAEELVVTERAVERHVTSIFSKLGLTTDDHAHRRVLAVLRHLGVN